MPIGNTCALRPSSWSLYHLILPIPFYTLKKTEVVLPSSYARPSSRTLYNLSLFFWEVKQRGEATVSTIVNLVEEVKVVTEVVKTPSYALFSNAKSLASGGFVYVAVCSTCNFKLSKMVHANFLFTLPLIFFLFDSLLHSSSHFLFHFISFKLNKTFNFQLNTKF